MVGLSFDAIRAAKVPASCLVKTEYLERKVWKGDIGMI